jgi:hypothetical protein
MGSFAAPIVGAVASGVVGKVLGGGKTSSTPTSTAPAKIEGKEFQPFTYRGAGGFGVTGSQTGDNGYSWSADVPTWLTDLGAGGAGAAGGLFQQYYDTAAQDPYAAADEYYKRGMDVLTPEFEKQNIALQERLFGTGRLGAVVGGVNPEAYAQNKAQQETLAKLYASSLSDAQTLQTNRLNQLSQAAEAAKNLGLLPMMTEQDLINFAADLETQRSNALSTYTQNLRTNETPQSVFAGQVANAVGTGFNNMFGGGSSDPYFGGQVGNVGFGPADGQSWGSYGSNLAGGGLWSGGNAYQTTGGGSYYDPMNDFYA